MKPVAATGCARRTEHVCTLLGFPSSRKCTVSTRCIVQCNMVQCISIIPGIYNVITTCTVATSSSFSLCVYLLHARSDVGKSVVVVVVPVAFTSHAFFPFASLRSTGVGRFVLITTPGGVTRVGACLQSPTRKTNENRTRFAWYVRVNFC